MAVARILVHDVACYSSSEEGMPNFVLSFTEGSCGNKFPIFFVTPRPVEIHHPRLKALTSLKFM